MHTSAQAPPRRLSWAGVRATRMSLDATTVAVGSLAVVGLHVADDSFVHVSFHNHRDDEANPIASTGAFAHFQDGHGDRREGAVDQQTAELVGAYITTLD